MIAQGDLAALADLEAECAASYRAWSNAKLNGERQAVVALHAAYADARTRLTNARMGANRWPEGVWVIEHSEWDGEQYVERLIGPFNSEDAGERWADEHNLHPFSCFDLYEPHEYLLTRGITNATDPSPECICGHAAVAHNGPPYGGVSTVGCGCDECGCAYYCSNVPAYTVTLGESSPSVAETDNAKGASDA